MSRVHLLRVLAFCGMLAPPFIVTIITIAGLLTPGYNHLTHTISSLSDQGSAHPGLMMTGFIIYGLLIICFACALYLGLRRDNKARITWFALTLYGVCMVFAGVFQDSPGALNTEGTLHNIAVITSCFAFLIGMWMFAGCVYKRPSWFGFTWFTIVASFLGLVLSIIFITPSQLPVSGLLQRFFYLVMLIWIEVVSLWLFRLSMVASPAKEARE